MPVARDEPYEQAWARPMLVVAKDYESSLLVSPAEATFTGAGIC